MSEFETGVSRYIRGVAQIEVFFPVDRKGNPDLSCKQCRYFDGRRICLLNGEIVNYPQYLGVHCPLYFPNGID